MEPARRLALGQWFTPPAVADLALALALPAGPARVRARVLDPACGDGAFLVRARAAGVAAANLAGVEIDPATAAAARAAAPGVRVDSANFFAGPPPAGLDAVVGNPPYVRHERLTDADKRAIRIALSRALPAASLDPASFDRVLGRADLAAAFVLAALAALRPGGRVAFVGSSAMLDAGYATALWRLALPLGQVVAVVDAPAERWFADAAVNAVVLVAERHADAPPAPTRAVALARLTVPTAAAAARLAAAADDDPLVALASVADVRLGRPDEPAAWPGLLRAPAAWFDLAAAAGPALRPLGELADVRRGVTSGANHVFYLSRDRAAALGLEPALLLPLLRSPRADGDRIAVDADRTPHVVLAAPADPAALAGFPAARRYLDGVAAAAAGATLAARPSWWSLAARPAPLFLTKAYHARFVQRFAAHPVVADQRLYAVTPRPGVDPELLAAALNGSATALALESLGRASLGEGALEWTVADAAALPVLDPARLPPAAARAARAAFRAMCRRAIGVVADEAERTDRAALDAALLAAAPSARPAEIRAALVAAVARRTGRRDAASPSFDRHHGIA